MGSHEQETSKSTQETETYSDAEMSEQAANAAIASAQQAERIENQVETTDDLLDYIDTILESEEFAIAFTQQGGQ